jgi:hypothetical protein
MRRNQYKNTIKSLSTRFAKSQFGQCLCTMHKSSLFYFAILPCSFLLASCVEPELRDTPANAIVRSFDALNNQDSVGYLETLAREKREVYEALPQAAHSLLEEWKGQHADVKVLSVESENGAATILYNLKITGQNTAEQDSLIAHSYLEEGGWKYGY